MPTTSPSLPEHGRRFPRDAQRPARCQVGPEVVGYINAHGTSTPIGDNLETMPSALFPAQSGGEFYQVYDRPLLGGAGGLEAGITVLALRDQMLPPTINLDNQDPDCDLDYVPNHARKVSGVRHVQFLWLWWHQRRSFVPPLGNLDFHKSKGLHCRVPIDPSASNHGKPTDIKSVIISAARVTVYWGNDTSVPDDCPYIPLPDASGTLTMGNLEDATSRHAKLTRNCCTSSHPCRQAGRGSGRLHRYQRTGQEPTDRMLPPVWGGNHFHDRRRHRPHEKGKVRRLCA